jgi:hypothetical protein
MGKFDERSTGCMVAIIQWWFLFHGSPLRVRKVRCYRGWGERERVNGHMGDTFVAAFIA